MSRNSPVFTDYLYNIAAVNTGRIKQLVDFHNTFSKRMKILNFAHFFRRESRGNSFHENIQNIINFCIAVIRNIRTCYSERFELLLYDVNAYTDYGYYFSNIKSTLYMLIIRRMKTEFFSCLNLISTGPFSRPLQFSGLRQLVPPSGNLLIRGSCDNKY